MYYLCILLTIFPIVCQFKLSSFKNIKQKFTILKPYSFFKINYFMSIVTLKI